MAALAKAEEVLAETEKTLAAAMGRLQKVEEGIEELRQKLRMEEEKKAELERQKQLCEDRMARAIRLIAGLSDEQKRWIFMVDDIKVALKNVIGDILLSSGAHEHFSITPLELFYVVYMQSRNVRLLTYLQSLLSILFLYHKTK